MRLRKGNVYLAVLLSCISISARATDQRLPPQQHNSGISWAQQAMLALTGGNPVNSVAESGTVTRDMGGDHQQGQITLQSSGLMTDQITVSLTPGSLSETRVWQNNVPSGTWTGFDGVQHTMAQHNCWTDAAWFFPALSLLADYADPNLVFTDLGQEQYQGGSVEHIQVYRTASGWQPVELRMLARMSTVDYYLDSQSALPVAMAFANHPDSDVGVDIQVMVVYSGYSPVGGIQVPQQIFKAVNGSTVLQISISSALPNH